MGPLKMLHSFINRTGLGFVGFYIQWLLALLTGTERQPCSKLSFFYLLQLHTFPTIQSTASSHGLFLTAWKLALILIPDELGVGGEVEIDNNLVCQIILLQVCPILESCGHQGALPRKTLDAVPLSSSWGNIPHTKQFLSFGTKSI